MSKQALWKWLILILLTAFSLALIYPPGEKIRLGLDLRGGTSFTVEITASNVEAQLRSDPDLKEATDAEIARRVPLEVKKMQEQVLEIIRNRVDAMGLSEPVIYPEKDNRVVVQIPGLKEEQREQAAKTIKKAAYLEFSMVHDENDKLVEKLFARGLSPEGYKIVSEENRGRSRHFYKRDLKPGEKDVVDENFRARMETFQAPTGFRFLLMEEKVGAQKLYIPYFARKVSELKGDSLKSAGIEYDQMSRPYVTLKFNKKGSVRFADITSKYAPGGIKNPNPEGRRYLAIVMDGKLYSAPYIKTAIFGGEAVIEGDFSMQEAQELAIVLRSGSLPVPVEIVWTVSVDPTLGKESIRSGTTAALYGSIAVAAFMIAYYLMTGVIANIGLLFNLILLPLGLMVTAGFLGLFAGSSMMSSSAIALPVLTLPGIAGIALTLGMAVDANVLINERIREELRAGKRLVTAVEAGYERAFLTIFDSNMTTVIAAVILFFFGTGAIRGFGITLAAGIVVSMYSSVVVTRMVFDFVVARTNLQTLHMLTFFKVTAIDFLARRKLAVSLSLVVIIGTWAFIGVRGFRDKALVLGTDFTGGSSITFAFNQKQPEDKIRAAIEARGVRDVNIQYQKAMEMSAEYLQVRTGFGAGDKAKAAVSETFASAGYHVIGEDSLGPQIGGEVMLKAVYALTIALLLMIVYISWRFEFAFAIGGIVALFHDVLMAAGLYCLCGRQINMTIVAALLTIIGYSINDTIVIFDRIRENVKLMRDKNFIEICNLSINQTLSRTILTSFATALSVLMLFFFGGGAINDFALIMIFGMISGTYSTVFIATPVMIWFKSKQKEHPAVAAKA
ncbi:MAG: protein translocase subunit SecD [Lentisphaerae bacterium]|nr:protein translocase subunit SecD [Lentisphaerota bacterium]